MNIYKGSRISQCKPADKDESPVTIDLAVRAAMTY